MSEGTIVRGITQRGGERRTSTLELWNRGVTIFLIYAVLVAGSAIFLLPFAWMVSTSLKAPQGLFAWPPQWIPNPLRWQNYPEAWTSLPFTRYFINTTLLTAHNTVASVCSSALAAFCFARLRARGRDTLFVLVLATMMVPWEVTMVPTFLLFTKLEWVNTYLPLALPRWFGSSFYIFLLRQFFMTIPYDLDDAARIDGCSTWRILWSIILPLSKPALATVAIFAIVGNWNDFLGPLIYLNRAELYTLAVGINMMRNTQYGSAIHLLMAVSVVSVVPIIVLYFSAQKYFIQGIALTGLKA